MHTNANDPAAPFGGVPAGTLLGPASFEVSAAANDRYWRGAGVHPPPGRPATLYPPLAANLTVLLFRLVAPRPLLHTRHRLACRGRADAPACLEVRGAVTGREVKRGRDYATVEAAVTLDDGTPLWKCVATFCEVAP